MAIGNLGDKVSNTAKNAVNKAKNKPEFEAGFEDTTFDDSLFDSIFDDLGDFGSSSSGSSSTSTAASTGGLNTPATGLNTPGNGLTSMSNPNGTTMNGLNGTGFNLNNGQQQPQAPPKKDAMDVIMEGAGKGGMATWRVFVDMVKGLSTRNYNDWADYGSALVKTGGILMASGLLLGILLSLLGLKGLGIGGASFSVLISGIVCMLCGVVTMTVTYYILTKDEYKSDIKNIPDVDSSQAFSGIGGESQLDTDKYSSLFDELMAVDDELEFEEEDFSTPEPTYEEYEDYEEPEEEIQPEEVNYDDMLSKVQENVVMINRKLLFETFKPFYAKNTPGFSQRRTLSEGEAEYENVEILTRQAFASACKVDLEEMEIIIEGIESSHFCYVIRVQRIKGMNKTDEIKREMEVYFRDTADDFSVNAEVVIERDCYKITITKGVKPIVTFGDCFGIQSVCDFYLNDDNKLPFIAGINDYGEPILADGKKYTTILVAGKQRSGKSWYVDSLLLSWMSFNTPEDVQFLIIDPKESNLFTTISYMPHVCGLHTEHNIIEIFRDIIEKEGKRRKKLLKDNKSDDIWDLRKRKGIMLPVLYIVIDEFMTVLDTLSKKGQDKEFISTMNVIITQLPSQGIFLLFVPHRAQGVVDKTTRELMTFTAAIRATTEVVKETLGVKWDRPLPDPGDTAINIDGKAMFVRGAALTTSDTDNMILIENIAKTFYKMGVEIPDMSSIGCGYNRDEDAIKDALCIGSTNSRKVQYNAHNIFDNLDDEEVGSDLDSEPD